ncbi:hypothetical protein ACEWPB_15610 [Priestia megaterium]|uniref:hypothetical protein n=1 Tax=Priestia megaterium TaxID=1404 RepID=UPI0035CACF61
MKNESLLKGVHEVYSFDTKDDTYELNTINFSTSKKLISFMERLYRLEREEKIVVFMRGFSFRDNQNHFSFVDHEHFKERELNKFFIVGQKGAHYLEEQQYKIKQLYTHNMQNRDQLIKEVKDLYKEANQILKEKQNEDVIGEINPKFNETSIETSLNQLQYNKLFLTAFLHNVGRRWSGKSTSPLISATYGKRKKETSKKFATNALSGVPRNKGFLLLGYIPIEDSKKFEKLTKDLNRELEEQGVSWYDDIHNELMLLDGIMPHRIIGLFEIDINSKEKLILNPWLNKMFLEKKNFNYKRGIKIDQSRFDEYAQDLKYGAYIWDTSEGRYNKTFMEKNYHLVPEFKLN